MDIVTCVCLQGNKLLHFLTNFSQNWERETKDLYESMYAELLNENEIAAANFVSRYVDEVDCELKGAEKMHIDLESAGYDIGFILANQ